MRFAILFPVIGWAPLSGSDPAEGAAWQSATYGYELDVAAGWVHVSKEVLDATMAQAIAANASPKPIFDAAFQLESSPELVLMYPYLLVQVIPYADYGASGQIHESDFDKVVESITGLDVQESWDRAVTPAVRELGAKPEIKSVKLDRERRRYTWDLSLEMAPFGRITGRCVGYFGRESIVQVAGYAKEDEWAQYEPDVTSMIDSLRFDAAHAYDESLARPSIWGRVANGGFRGAIIGGIAGGLGALIAAMFKRKR